MLKTTPHEIEVTKRLMNLQTMSTAPTALNLPEIYFRLIRVEIPEVILGFVYVLVSLKDKTLKTTYAGQTKRSVLTRLHEHNSGYGGNFTLPLHRRPWSLAAFCYNFQNDSDRLLMETSLHRLLFFDLRIDTLVDEFRTLCISNQFGNLVFCCCGTVIS